MKKNTMNTKQNKVAFLILIIGKNKIKKMLSQNRETFGSSTVYLVFFLYASYNYLLDWRNNQV